MRIITKSEVADFYMIELINAENENEAISKLSEWVGAVEE